MEFPFFYTYRYVCHYRAEPEALLRQYETSLHTEGARNVRRNGPVLAFDRAAFLRGGSWKYSATQLFTEGHIEVSRDGTQTEIKARVSLFEAVFVIGMISVFAIGIPGLFMEGAHWSIGVVTFAGWLAMLGAMYGFVRRELQNIVRQVEQNSLQSPTLR